MPRFAPEKLCLTVGSVYREILGKGEGCGPGEAVEADKRQTSNIDRQMRAEKRGHREEQKENTGRERESFSVQSMHPVAGAPDISHC